MVAVQDKAFLQSVQAMMAEPDSADIAVTYMAEIAPGILLARETDGEVIVYVNLEVYKQNHAFRTDFHLRERDAMPENIGVVQDVMCRSLDGIIELAKKMVVLKDGSLPDYYDERVVMN